MLSFPIFLSENVETAGWVKINTLETSRLVRLSGSIKLKRNKEDEMRLYQKMILAESGLE